jgi:Icc-related predicted phosphoesterase
MKILSVSDVELSFIYSAHIAERFRDVDLIISCGDLPHYYLEYMISMLDIPLYYVHGNHASKAEISAEGERSEPWGGINLHRRIRRDPSGLLLAGIEGSLQYNFGPHQYSQTEMWMFVFGLVPGLMLNKLRYGRYLDIFVTHASPWKIHDMDDRPHRGAKAFRWLIDVFQPKYHLHGHIHVYRSDTVTETVIGRTHVMNTFGYREINIDTLSLWLRRRRELE